MSDNGISVGGLASGLDTTSIITGLISIEQNRVIREQQAQQAYELKLSTFNDLKTKLSDFYSKAQALDKTTAFDLFKGTSSDDGVATITGEAGATAGNFDLKVAGLASTLKVASKSFASSTASQAFTGEFKMSVSAAALKADPTVTDVTIDIAASDGLKDIAAKINRAKGAGATASIIQMGTGDYRLMLTAVDEGTKAFSLTPVNGQNVLSTGLGIVNPANGDPTAANKAMRTDFDLRLAAGGPATTATALVGNALFNGLGSNKAITAGDTISWTATDANGTARDGSFTIAGGSTVQSMLSAIELAFEDDDADGTADGDYVDVSLNTSGEIVIKDKTGGSSNFTLNMSFADSDASGSALNLGTSVAQTDFANVVSQGKKAFYLMNDISVSSQTNQDNKTVAGTVFQLKRVDMTQTVKLQLQYDKDGIQKRVQEFLDGYNMIMKFVDDKSKVDVQQKDANGNPADKNNKDRVSKGPFAGDSTILALKGQLQSLLTNKISELSDQGLTKYSSLAALGITSDRNTGLLVIDDTTFKTALDTDLEGVKRLFVTNGYTSNSAHTFGTFTKDTKTGVYNIDPATSRIDTNKGSGTTWSVGTWSGAGDILNSNSGDSKGMAVQAPPASGAGTVTFVRGVAGQIKAFYDKANNFVDGFLTNTGKGIQKRIDDEKLKITRLEKHVSDVKTRLTTQFANLELSISKLQQQSAAFGGQVSSLKR